MTISFSGKTLNENAQTPKRLSVETKNLVSAEYAIDAPAAVITQRRNAKTYAAFEIERCHGSETEAAEFALSHAAELNLNLGGLLKFSDDDRPEADISIDDAVLISVKTEVAGLCTDTKYQFIQA